MNMRLLPEPKKIQATQGVFDYSDSAVVLAGEHDPRVVRAADALRRMLERDTGHPCRLIHSTVEAVPQKGCVDMYLDWPLEYQYHDLLAACSRHIPFREDEVPLHDYYFSLKEVDSLEQLR